MIGCIWHYSFFWDIAGDTYVLTRMECEMPDNMKSEEMVLRVVTCLKEV